MIMDTNIREVNSIEEFTLFSIDRSAAGIDTLLKDAENCSSLITQDNQKETLNRLSRLTQNLHDFSIFQHDVCSLFEIDNTKIKYGRSSLAAIEQKFRTSLTNLGVKVENRDLGGIQTVLIKELTPALKKMKSVMPVLRNYIDETYLQEERS